MTFLPMFCACSFHGNPMNNLLSYCGLVDARINAFEKDLPVRILDFIQYSILIFQAEELVGFDGNYRNKRDLTEQDQSRISNIPNKNNPNQPNEGNLKQAIHPRFRNQIEENEQLNPKYINEYSISPPWAIIIASASILLNFILGLYIYRHILVHESTKR